MNKGCSRAIEIGLLMTFLASSGSSRTSAEGASAPAATPGAVATVTCALSHPSYSGWCRVTSDISTRAGAKRFCSQTLACLNDVRCTRTYCNATTIRLGWKLESVQTAFKKE